MNKRIERLATRLIKLKDSQRAKRNALEDQLRDAWAEHFKAHVGLKEDLARLEASRDYGSDECGIYAWVRIQAEYTDSERDALDEYLCLSEGIRFDKDNDALQRYEGESIVIGEEGDVFLVDSPGCGKVIVRAKEYETERERNALIEAWMERNGYFPGVFEESRYGDVRLINTKENEE